MRTKVICGILMIFLVFALLISCGETEYVEITELSLEELAACVDVAEYKGVTFEADGANKQDIIKDHLKNESKVKKYPEGAVEYYLEQLKKQYDYYANEAGIEYDALLEELSLSEEKLEKEAEALVFEDMIFAIIQKKENITVTDSDKEKYFDRFVTKYAEIHKYSEDYVRQNLTDEVYQTMLHDKTMEYLIINNIFK